LDLENEIMIPWTANENIWYDSVLIATNVISNTLEYALGTDRLTWKGVGRGGGGGGGGVMLWFVPKNYSDARFSPIKIAFVFTAELEP
jgi:hypothetical protein